MLNGVYLASNIADVFVFANDLTTCLVIDLWIGASQLKVVHHVIVDNSG